jgi:hypothetical protein
MKMKAVISSETLVPTYETAWCYDAEDDSMHLHHCGNLKSDERIF